MSLYALIDPAVNALHDALMTVAHALPGSLTTQLLLAVVLVTIAIRAALLPVALQAHRGQRQREALAPQIALLRTKHGKDPQRLNQELMDLHRAAGISPVTGLGSSLLMAPVFLVLYRSVRLMGPPVGTHWVPLLSTGALTPIALFTLLVAALLLIAWLSSRKLTGPLRVVPYGTVAFAALAPVAVSVYLVTSGAWTVLERTLLPHLT